MIHRPARCIALCLGLLLATPALAQFSDVGDSRDVVRVTVYPARVNLAPGDDLRIAVILDHHANWHTHTNAPIVPPELGDPQDYIKTEIRIAIPPDGPLIAHPQLTKWPKPHLTTVRFLGTPVEYAVFAERSIAYLPLVVRNDAALGTASLTINMTYQACSDMVCLSPVRDQPFLLAFNIVAPDQATPVANIDQDLFGDFPEHVFVGLDRGPNRTASSGTVAIRYIIIGAIVAVSLILGVFGLMKVLRK